MKSLFCALVILVAAFFVFESLRSSMSSVKVGEMAPDFTLTSQTGEKIQLSRFRGKKTVVLFFYPKDNTPGCTKESCAFRDSYEEFQKSGAEVIGISSDSVSSHQNFATQFHLPFHLLSDEGGVVRKLYGVPATLGLFPGRMTYVIDREGVVRHSFSSQFRPAKHIQESLGILKEIQK